MQELVKTALDYYWKFMFEHAFLGVVLTLSTLGWIVTGIRALKGLREEPAAAAENPPRATSGPVRVTPPRPPAPPQAPKAPNAPSRYDRLLSDDD